MAMFRFVLQQKTHVIGIWLPIFYSMVQLEICPEFSGIHPLNQHFKNIAKHSEQCANPAESSVQTCEHDNT